MVLDQAVSLTMYVLSQSRGCISLENGCLGWHKLWLSSRDINCPIEKAESHPCALRELERIKSKTITASQIPGALRTFFFFFFFLWREEKALIY